MQIVDSWCGGRWTDIPVLQVTLETDDGYGFASDFSVVVL
jgi:hypothetical protein